MAKYKGPFIIKGVSPEQWIETKYGGRTYLVGVRSLLDAYIMRNMEKEDGKSNDESADGPCAHATE
jgi:hypothetical protein